MVSEPRWLDPGLWPYFLAFSHHPEFLGFPQKYDFVLKKIKKRVKVTPPKRREFKEKVKKSDFTMCIIKPEKVVAYNELNTFSLTQIILPKDLEY